MEKREHLLKIYKASAGSGKTYRLTIEFLKYVIEDPTCYERILAVTFTNKATAEMKTRIISTLYGIANNLEESQSDIDNICRELGENDVKFQSRSLIVAQARIALSMMLHNFSNFHIETIDSFFQTVLRNLEKELGLGTHLNLELDVKPLLSEAVDVLMDEITKNKLLCNWVSRFVSDQIESEGSGAVTDKIAEFSENLFSEKFRLRSEKMFDLVRRDESCITKYLTKLQDEKDKKYYAISCLTQKFHNFNDEHGYTEKDYTNMSRGLYGYIEKLAQGKDSNRGKNITSLMNREVSPFKKGVGDAEEEEYVLHILDEIEENRTKIRELGYIQKNFFCVGLMFFIDKFIREINEEKNQFVLSDTQMLLNKMIEDSDAPFIYEKIGTYLDHIMIDEFQDTSETQWNNFKPLILDCASRGMDSLIVGDQKQSIYRFRNGNWQLLGNLKDEMAHISPEVISLNTNFRSESKIVEFNNFIFNKMPGLYKDGQNEHPLLDKMIQAYDDVSQKCKKAEKAEQGYVKALFLEGDNKQEYKEQVLRALSEEIKFYQQQGIKPEQMAILVNKNDYIADMAEYFVSYQMEDGNQDYCFDLISEQAYMLESSETIQCVISAMRYIAMSMISVDEYAEKHKCNLAIVQLLYLYEQIGKKKRESENEVILPNPHQLTDGEEKFLDSIKQLSMLPLYEMVEEIYRIMQLERIADQESYYCFFLDKINEFLTKKSSDLNLFLKYWEEYLHALSIPSGEASGIRVMTIHKSKGLQFHTVLIPFCDWGLKEVGNHTTYLWENTESMPAPLNDFPLVAIKKQKPLSDTIFRESFYKEEVEENMDKLNLLYVALTRAKNNMSIFGMRKKENKQDENDQYVSHRLENIIRSSGTENWDEENHLYIFGEVDAEKTDTDPLSENPFNRIPDKLSFNCNTYQQKGRFRQSNKSNDFIEDKESESPTNEYIDRGKLLHYLFSKIATADDIEKVINEMEFDGLFESMEQKNNILASVRKAMETENAKKWFRPGLKLYNECSILFRDEDGDLQKRRPDRVICEGNHMTVIDFKFGKPIPRHQEQIDEYVDLLKRMGYEAEGHIWYLNYLFS